MNEQPRGHRLRASALGVVVFGALVGASPAEAGSALIFSDVAGDANGANTQGERGFSDEGDLQTEPASVATADIVRVALRPLENVSTATGFSVTLVLSGDVSHKHMYALVGYKNLSCGLTIRYRAPRAMATGCGGDRMRLPDPTVVGPRLTIFVPLALLPRGIRPAQVLREIFAYTVPQVAPPSRPLYAPKLDIAGTKKSFTIPEP